MKKDGIINYLPLRRKDILYLFLLIKYANENNISEIIPNIPKNHKKIEKELIDFFENELKSID